MDFWTVSHKNDPPHTMAKRKHKSLELTIVSGFCCFRACYLKKNPNFVLPVPKTKNGPFYRRHFAASARKTLHL